MRSGRPPILAAGGVGCWVLGAGCWVLGSVWHRFWRLAVLGAGCRVPGAGCRVPGARVPGAGCPGERIGGKESKAS